MSCSPAKKAKLLKLYGNVCLYCSKELTAHSMTVEHLIARSIGGSGMLNNLAPACHKCNCKRGNTDLTTFIARQLNSRSIKAKIEYVQALLVIRNEKLLDIIRNSIITKRPTSHQRFWSNMGYR